MIRQRPGTAVGGGRGGGRYPTLNLCRSRHRRISGPISHEFAQTEGTMIPRLGGDEGSDLKWLKGAAVSGWMGGGYLLGVSGGEEMAEEGDGNNNRSVMMEGDKNRKNRGC